MSEPEYEDLLETALYDGSPVERDAARAALLIKPNRQRAKWLFGLLDAPQKLTRRRAVRLLGDMPPKIVRPDVERLFKTLDGPVRVVVAIARMLSAQTKDSEPLLALGLASDNPQIRQACATRAAPEQALISCLSDDNATVRNKCAQCLNELERTIDSEVIEHLVNLVTEADEQCLRLIASCQPDHAVFTRLGAGHERLLDFAKLPEQVHGHVASNEQQKAWALSRLDAMNADCGHSSDPVIRSAFARTCKPDNPALKRLVQDPDQVVRWIADRAKSGAYSPFTLNSRVLPHARLDLPSAHPPYGIREGDERVAPPRVQAALALCHGRIDVNIGVAVRSAEAAGFSEVFVVGGRPLMRTAMRGTDRVMNVEQVADGAALLTLARAKGYQLVAVQQTPCSEPYHEANYPPKPLFMMGSEDLGLPDSLRIAADLAIEIPMFGEIDSLNVATAATTVMFHWRIHHASTE
jgi:tRNA(Leu) C34 or U34 (ribose-2'-O)-methylase TrmL